MNREAAKISALSSGKFDKYEYLAGEEILPSNQRQIIEEAKFLYCPIGKVFQRQRKTRIRVKSGNQENRVKSGTRIN